MIRWIWTLWSWKMTELCDQILWERCRKDCMPAWNYSTAPTTTFRWDREHSRDFLDPQQKSNCRYRKGCQQLSNEQQDILHVWFYRLFARHWKEFEWSWRFSCGHPVPEATIFEGWSTTIRWRSCQRLLTRCWRACQVWNQISWTAWRFLRSYTESPASMGHFCWPKVQNLFAAASADFLEFNTAGHQSGSFISGCLQRLWALSFFASDLTAYDNDLYSDMVGLLTMYWISVSDRFSCFCWSLRIAYEWKQSLCQIELCFRMRWHGLTTNR